MRKFFIAGQDSAEASGVSDLRTTESPGVSELSTAESDTAEAQPTSIERQSAIFLRRYKRHRRISFAGLGVLGGSLGLGLMLANNSILFFGILIGAILTTIGFSIEPKEPYWEKEP